jgi:hypothetical protein
LENLLTTVAQSTFVVVAQCISVPSSYVRKHIGSRMRLRLTPEIRFFYDESSERGERVSSPWKISKQLSGYEFDCYVKCCVLSSIDHIEWSAEFVGFEAVGNDQE